MCIFRKAMALLRIPEKLPQKHWPPALRVYYKYLSYSSSSKVYIMSICVEDRNVFARFDETLSIAF